MSAESYGYTSGDAIDNVHQIEPIESRIPAPQGSNNLPPFLFASSNSTTTVDRIDELLRSSSSPGFFFNSTSSVSRSLFSNNASGLGFVSREVSLANNGQQQASSACSPVQEASGTSQEKILISGGAVTLESEQAVLNRIQIPTTNDTSAKLLDTIVTSVDWAPTVLDATQGYFDPGDVFKTSTQSSNGIPPMLPFKFGRAGRSKFDFNAMFQAQLAGANVGSDLNQPEPALHVSSSLANTSSAVQKPLATVENVVSSADGFSEISESDAAIVLRQLSHSTSVVNEASDSIDPETTIMLKPKRKRKRPNYEPAQKMYVTPTDEDVLLGRGGRTNHHPGNHRYLEAKDTIQPRYLKESKDEKTKISQELVDIVHQWGGRFLKLDTQQNQWYEVANIVARKKASQTLREHNTAEERAAKRERYQYLYGKASSACSHSGSQTDSSA